MEQIEIFEQSVNPKVEEVVFDKQYGLQCKMTYAEFTEMKRTNPDWKGPIPIEFTTLTKEEVESGRPKDAYDYLL